MGRGFQINRFSHGFTPGPPDQRISEQPAFRPFRQNDLDEPWIFRSRTPNRFALRPECSLARWRGASCLTIHLQRRSPRPSSGKSPREFTCWAPTFRMSRMPQSTRARSGVYAIWLTLWPRGRPADRRPAKSSSHHSSQSRAGATSPAPVHHVPHLGIRRSGPFSDRDSVIYHL